MIYPSRQALDRPQGRTACRVGLETFENRRIAQLQEARIARDPVQNEPVPNTDFGCPDCQCHCRLRIGLISHRRKHANPPQLMLLTSPRRRQATPSTNAFDRKEICRNDGSDHQLSAKELSDN